MQTRTKLACLLLAGVMLLPGCGANSGGQNNKVDKAASSGHVAEKKKDASDYELASVKYYDADGTCTMDVMYEYNEEGKDVHRVQHNYGDLARTDESFFTYPDEKTCQQTYIDQNSGTRSQVVTSTYNEDGQVQTEISTDYQADGSGNVMDQTEYTYDKHGNLIRKEKHSTATVGHELNHISITEYTYDSAGNRLTEKLTSSSDSAEDQVFTDSEYQYDGKGNKTREISKIKNEYTYSPILYEYNRKDQMIKELDYASTAPDTLKQYWTFEYDENGNRQKASRFSPEDQLLSYVEYEYIKIGDLASKEKTIDGKDGLYKTWSVDGTAESTIRFQLIDPASGVRCEVKNYDIRAQQESTGGTSTTVEVTDKTIKINSAPEVYTTFDYWFEADGTLKLMDEFTGNIVSLHAQ